MKESDILKKIIFNSKFRNISNSNNEISFIFDNEYYKINNGILFPKNNILNKMFGLVELSKKHTKRQDVEIQKTENYGDDHPYVEIIKNGKPLSWTGSAGVDKFISCPRLAFLSAKRQRKIFPDSSLASMAIGTFIHEYILRDSFSISDAREALRYFINFHLPAFPQHIGIDIINTIYKGRKVLFDIFSELGSGYTARYEEMTMSVYNKLNFIQYVDAYAYKFENGKLKVMIVDVKTSSRAAIKEMSYWGQLLYYRYNLRKKLALEFNIKEEEIEFETRILWVFYKKLPKTTFLIKSIETEDKEVILSSPIMDISMEKIIKNSKFILPMINVTYKNKKTINFYNVVLDKKEDKTKIATSKVFLTNEHEEYLKSDMDKASTIIYNGDTSPNFHSCNKSVWGCDYESICHFKTKQAKGAFIDKEHMKKTSYQNLDDELVKKVIPNW